MNLTPKDRQVTRAFACKQAAKGPFLSSDGQHLWAGETLFAEWKDGNIIMHVRRVEQALQRATRRRRR